MKTETSLAVVVALVVAFGGLWYVGNSFFGLGQFKNLTGDVVSQEEETDGVLTASVLRSVVNDELGAYVTDTRGMTLYSTSLEECADECLSVWPPYYADEEVAGDDSKLGTMRRVDNGRLQYTWGGTPLYYYSGDENVGDTSGHGVGDAWFVATP